MKEGDIIDAVMHDLKYDVQGWTKAKVVDTTENHIKVSFLNQSDEFDKIYNKTDTFI